MKRSYTTLAVSYNYSGKEVVAFVISKIVEVVIIGLSDNLSFQLLFLEYIEQC